MKLRQTYGDKIRIVFKDFPLPNHAMAAKAAEAAHCAGDQGKYWEMHDRLFANQKALMPADLLTHAQALGLDQESFTKCLAGQMTARVRADLAMGAQAGVGSTPNFFVGVPQPGGKIKVLRKLNGAVPFASFKSTIDGLLATLAPAQ